MKRIRIFDTTLRDGEQSPGCSMNLSEKIEMARQLEALGVDVIEAGFAIASPMDHKSVKTIAAAVTNCTVHAYRGKSGMVTVECRTDGSALHIRVGDRGAGIADVNAALQPFFTTLPSDERSGMGFTIMQTFMDEFSVSSKEGEGTLVCMTKRFEPEVENA